MNSQIMATIGFSWTILIKLQDITLALGNISANIFPKILPLQVQQALGRASANFPPHQKYEMEGSKCTWILLKRVYVEAKFDLISDFPV